MTRLGLTAWAVGWLGLLSCASTPATVASWRPLETSARENWLLEIQAGPASALPVVLSGAALHTARLTGTAEPDGPGWRLHLTDLEWFNSWANGWTEVEFGLEGSGRIDPTHEGWTLDLTPPAPTPNPRQASLRYFDEFTHGEAGLRDFQNRWARILAVVRELPATLTGDPAQRRALEQYLFPEIAGYAEPVPSLANRVTALGIDWNTDYSAAHFSMRLRALRDSGTLWRDYRESPELWALALAWPHLWPATLRLTDHWQPPRFISAHSWEAAVNVIAPMRGIYELQAERGVTDDGSLSVVGLARYYSSDLANRVGSELKINGRYYPGLDRQGFFVALGTGVGDQTVMPYYTTNSQPAQIRFCPVGGGLGWKWVWGQFAAELVFGYDYPLVWTDFSSNPTAVKVGDFGVEGGFSAGWRF